MAVLKHKRRIFILFGLFLLGLAITYFFELGYFGGLLATYTVPFLLNLFWLNRCKAKIIKFSIITTIFFAIPIEFLCRLTNSWDVQSMFPRILGIAPVENLVYAFINFAWVLAFYEYFVDRESRPKFASKWKWLVALYILFFAGTFGFYFANSGSIGGFDYWFIGLVFLAVPLVLIFGRKPKLIFKVIVPTIFFALVFFLHESVALVMGHWWWPGEYLWPVEFFGKVFPLDDVLIWYVLSTPALIGGYEFFADDYK